MDELFLDAVRSILAQPRTVDTLGFTHYIHDSLLTNLETCYVRHCKKHGIRYAIPHVSHVVKQSSVPT